MCRCRRAEEEMGKLDGSSVSGQGRAVGGRVIGHTRVRIVMVGCRAKRTRFARAHEAGEQQLEE